MITLNLTDREAGLLTDFLMEAGSNAIDARKACVAEAKRIATEKPNAPEDLIEFDTLIERALDFGIAASEFANMVTRVSEAVEAARGK